MTGKRISVGGGAYHKWQIEGEVLMGEWRGFSAGKPGLDGKATVVGTLETEAGEVRFSATTVLRTKLGRVREGFPVWITFLGVPNGKRYKDFSVEVDDEDALAPEEPAS